MNAQPGIPDRPGVTFESVFVGAGMRASGRLRYYPCRLSLVPHLLAEELPPDVVLLHTSSPRKTSTTRSRPRSRCHPPRLARSPPRREALATGLPPSSRKTPPSSSGSALCPTRCWPRSAAAAACRSGRRCSATACSAWKGRSPRSRSPHHRIVRVRQRRTVRMTGPAALLRASDVQRAGLRQATREARGPRPASSVARTAPSSSRPGIPAARPGA